LAKDFKEDAVKEQEVEESLAADKSMESKWWKHYHQQRKNSTDKDDSPPPMPKNHMPPEPQQFKDRDDLLNQKI
jgi:hypothetical protein